MANAISITIFFVIIFGSLLAFNYLPEYWDNNFKLLFMVIPLGLGFFFIAKT